MVIHILDLSNDSYQLTKRVIRSFINLVRVNEKNHSVFILVGEISNERKFFFDDFFKQYGYRDYQYCKVNEIRKVLRKYFQYPVIIHGGSYPVMLRCIFYKRKNIYWICWGGGSSINYNSFRSILFSPIKRFIYHQFKRVIALMEQDKKTLQADFHLKRVDVLSYYSETDSETQAIINKAYTNQPCENKLIVYLGNSGHCIESYITILKTLIPFKDKLEIHCMLPYGIKGKDEEINKINQLKDTVFGETLILDYDYMDYNNYLEYMSKCNVYVCGVKNQSGLGAVKTTLELGKKIYLTGKNLEFLKESNYIVFDIADLSKSIFEDLTLDQRDHNSKLQNENNHKWQQPWCNYLKMIQK